MISRPVAAFFAAALALCPGIYASSAPQAQSTAMVSGASGGAASITPDELKEWLSYIASDQLQGRRVYEEGLGLAAAYIAAHLKEWSVKPAGGHGGHLQAGEGPGGGQKNNTR